MNVATEFVAQALSLPPTQREELAWMLLESLPGEVDAQVAVSAELEEMIRTRLAEHESGSARTVNIAEFAAAVRAAARQPASP